MMRTPAQDYDCGDEDEDGEMSAWQPCGRRLRECIDDVCRSMGGCAWPPETPQEAVTGAMSETTPGDRPYPAFGDDPARWGLAPETPMTAAEAEDAERREAWEEAPRTGGKSARQATRGGLTP